MAARRGMPVICQKPMATSLAEAEQMVRICLENRVPFYIHENWRWQSQIREFKKVLDSGQIGTPFRARLFLVSGYPVFNNEPSIKEQEHFILQDMGPHILDVADSFSARRTSSTARLITFKRTSEAKMRRP